MKLVLRLLICLAITVAVLFVSYHSTNLNPQSNNQCQQAKGYPIPFQSVSADCQKTFHWPNLVIDFVLIFGVSYLLISTMAYFFPEKPKGKSLKTKSFQLAGLELVTGFFWLFIVFMIAGGQANSLGFLLLPAIGVVLGGACYWLYLKWKKTGLLAQFWHVSNKILFLFGLIVVVNVVLFITLTIMVATKFYSDNPQLVYYALAPLLTFMITTLFLIVESIAYLRTHKRK